jgi:cytoskeletal protein RodZ
VDVTQAPNTQNEAVDYARRPKKKKSRSPEKIIAVITILVLLAGGGAFAYVKLLANKPQPKKATTTTQSKQQPQEQQQTQPTETTNGDTKTYTSSNFKLGVSYPSTWTPSETTGQLTISSPVMDITDATGASTKGEIQLTVRHKTAKPDEYKGGSAVAVLPSEKVNYTHPTGNQRKSTYLSFLQYAGTTTKGGLDGVYITGSFGYKYAQNVPVTDISQIDPLVNVVFMRCPASDQTACAPSGQTPLTVSSTLWKDSSFKQPIVDMLTSLTFN